MALTRLSSTRDFFRVWFTWKYHASIIFILIVLIVAVFTLTATPMYESRAKVLILPRSTEGVIITGDTELDRIDLVNREDVNTEIELLTSENVIRKTVETMMASGQGFGPAGAESVKSRGLVKGALQNILITLGIRKPLSEMDARIEILQKSLKVEPVAFSDIIIVILKSPYPEAGAAILNQLLITYVQHHNQVFSKDEGVKFYADQAAEYQNKLAQAELKLKEFQSRWHIVDLESQHVNRIEQISELNTELKHIEISIDESESKIAMLKKGLKNGVEITKEMRTIPAIVELEKALVPLYIERSRISRNFTQSSREYRDVDDHVKIVLGHIRDEVEKAIQTEQLELNVLKAKQNSLSQKIASTQREADTLVQKERLFDDLERQIELLKDNYMLYASKTEDARIYSERKKRNLANVSIAENASIPTRPSFPRKRLMLAIAFMIGMFAALGSPFIFEFLDHRIKTADEVQTFLSLPVVCTLPQVKGSVFIKGEIENG